MISAVKLFGPVFAVVLFAAADEPEFFGETQAAFGPKIGERLPYLLPVDQLPTSAYGQLSVSSTLE